MSDPRARVPPLPAPEWSEEIVALLPLPGSARGAVRAARRPARRPPDRARASGPPGRRPRLVFRAPARLAATVVRAHRARRRRRRRLLGGHDHRAHVDATRGLGRRRVAARAGHPGGRRSSWTRSRTTSSSRATADTACEVRRHDGRLVQLRIEADDLDGIDRVLQIDPERRVVVGEVSERAGRVVSRVRHGGFVEVGGLWWPRLTRVFDERERMTAFVSTEVTALEAEAFDGAFDAATAVADGVLFLDGRLPDAADATQATHESRATFADHLRLALHEAGTQRWDEALAAWRAARALAATRRAPPGSISRSCSGHGGARPCSRTCGPWRTARARRRRGPVRPGGRRSRRERAAGSAGTPRGRLAGRRRARGAGLRPRPVRRPRPGRTQRRGARRPRARRSGLAPGPRGAARSRLRPRWRSATWTRAIALLDERATYRRAPAVHARGARVALRAADGRPVERTATRRPRRRRSRPGRRRPPRRRRGDA